MTPWGVSRQNGTMRPAQRACLSFLAAVLVSTGDGFPFAAAARAGTVINTNLPAGTTIVNINAQTDGAAAYSQPNPPQAFWYQPFTLDTANGFASVTLAAGTYAFRIIDPADAAAIFPNLTNTQLSQVYTGWTFNSPWTENYFAFRSTALSDPNEFQLFDGAFDPAASTYASAQAAYDGTLANGFFDQVRPAPPGRAGISPSDYQTTYTFNATTTVLFVIPDNILGDNAGGVSVVITAVPEPSTTALALGAGGVLLLRCWRRRR